MICNILFESYLFNSVKKISKRFMQRFTQLETQIQIFFIRVLFKILLVVFNNILRFINVDESN